MRKLLSLVPVMALLLCGFACPSNPNNLEQNARDAAAALGGELSSAQQQNVAACTADATQPACVTITRGINGQNALITALETYCGWPTTTAPPPVGTVCAPVKTAEGVLNVAIANANQLVTEVKGTVKP